MKQPTVERSPRGRRRTTRTSTRSVWASALLGLVWLAAGACTETESASGLSGGGAAFEDGDRAPAKRDADAASDDSRSFGGGGLEAMAAADGGGGGQACIANGLCCGAPPLGNASRSLGIESCAGSTACPAPSSGATDFGIPPAFGAAALTPLGIEADSGTLLDQEFDLRNERLRVDITFQAAQGCSANCLQASAVGLTTQDNLLTQPAVRPLVSLVHSTTAQQVSLVVDSVVRQRWWSPEPTQRWSLTLTPDGSIEVHRESVSMLSSPVTFSPTASARLVLYGRTDDNAAERAGVASLTWEVAVCDFPTAWDTRATVAIATSSGLPFAPRNIANPSTASDTAGQAVVAFSEERTRILIGSGPGAALQLSTPRTSPALDASAVGFAVAIDDPELVLGGERRLYFSAIEADGSKSIGLARALSPSWRFSTASKVLDPEDYPGVQSFEAPSVYAGGSGELLVTLATLDDGSQDFWFFTSMDGVAWADLGATELRALVSDGTELGSPTLVLHHYTWQLYYAHRTGSRWSIAHAVSDDLVEWRNAASTTSVLEALPGSPDALGVRSPGASAEDFTHTLYYIGTDGTTDTLRRVLRQAHPTATDSGSFAN